MSAASSPAVARRVRAAVEVAAAAGVRCEDPLVLHDRSNVLVHLRPAPVVARVAGSTAAVREGDGWLAREVAVATHLARAGAPVVAPSALVDPGPHRHDGLALSFWELAPAVPRAPDAHAAGAGLRACHEALRSFEGDLPAMGALVEARALAARLAAEGAVGAQDGEALERAGAEAEERIAGLGLPLQPVHGDAHLGNVVATARGPLWNDWEDTFLGPVGWDLGCLRASAVAFGNDPSPVAEAEDGYGPALDDDALAAFVAARRFQGTVWIAAVARERPDVRGRAAALLAAIRGSLG